jgi:2-polyprenyl-3-methyl-5-hydroxy-6-metoxy-1,4-benzoquinol methylase
MTDIAALGLPLKPATNRLCRAVLGVWPDHEKFLLKSLSGRPEDLQATAEFIAQLLLDVAADSGVDIARYAEDYRYLCENIVFPEEVFFGREGRYRLSTFAQAAKEVYDNPGVMTRYMNGLFISDALWLNHAGAMNDFVNSYLPGIFRGGSHLEIGPGHGMLLHLAIASGKFENLSAWDVSATSIDHTRYILKLRNCSDRVNIQLGNIYDPVLLNAHRGRFDTIVLSEVLEHLEKPREALEIIRELLAPGGSVWINVPANGPAPDHLFLLRSPQEASEFVSSAGLTVTRSAAYPLAGYSLERAIRNALPISCVVVGSRPA